MNNHYSIRDFNWSISKNGAIQSLTSPRCDAIKFTSLLHDSDALDDIHLRIMTFKDMEESSVLFSDRHPEEPNTELYLVIGNNLTVELIGQNNDMSDAQALMNAIKSLELKLIKDIYHVVIEDNLI